MTLPRRQDWLGAALLACGLVTLAGPAGAQDAVIHGRVINDRGEGLPVATVQIQELNVGVFTNSEGRYAMQIPAARVTGQTVMLRVRTIGDRKSTRLNSSHSQISYAVFCLKKKTTSVNSR